MGQSESFVHPVEPPVLTVPAVGTEPPAEEFRLETPPEAAAAPPVETNVLLVVAATPPVGTPPVGVVARLDAPPGVGLPIALVAPPTRDVLGAVLVPLGTLGSSRRRKRIGQERS